MLGNYTVLDQLTEEEIIKLLKEMNVPSPYYYLDKNGDLIDWEGK